MRHAWLLIGLLLVVGGAVTLVLAGDPRHDDLGWFAYTPLEPYDTSEAYASTLELQLDQAVVVTRERVLGAVAVVLGLVVLAGALGHRLGRRTASSAGGA